MDSLSTLTSRAVLLIEKYKEMYPDVHMGTDYLPFKITEEWGECIQAYLMLTDRGRQKGKSKEEIAELLAQECADVFGYLLVFAHNEGIDLVSAINKKWFSHLEPTS